LARAEFAPNVGKNRGSVDKNEEGRVHVEAVLATLAIRINGPDPYLVCICYSPSAVNVCTDGGGPGLNRLRGCHRSELCKAIADLKTKVDKVAALLMV
jgi:hypothetical protein